MWNIGNNGSMTEIWVPVHSTSWLWWPFFIFCIHGYPKKQMFMVHEDFICMVMALSSLKKVIFISWLLNQNIRIVFQVSKIIILKLHSWAMDCRVFHSYRVAIICSQGIIDANWSLKRLSVQLNRCWKGTDDGFSAWEVWDQEAAGDANFRQDSDYGTHFLLDGSAGWEKVTFIDSNWK